MPLKQIYTATEINPGDIFGVTVTLHIPHIDHDKKIIYVKMYRCLIDEYGKPGATEEGIPQGHALPYARVLTMVDVLFPSVRRSDYTLEIL